MTKSFLNALVVALAAGAAVPDPAAAACGPTTFTRIAGSGDVVTGSMTGGSSTFTSTGFRRQPAINTRGAVAFAANSEDGVVYARGYGGALSFVSLLGGFTTDVAENPTIGYSAATEKHLAAYAANQLPDGAGVYRWSDGTVTMIGNVDGVVTVGKGIITAHPLDPPVVSDTGLVAFTARLDSSAGSAVLVGNGTALEKLAVTTVSPSSLLLRHAHISPGGNWLAFSGGPTTSYPGIYRLQVSESGGTITGTAPVSVAGLSLLTPVAINDSGTVAYVSGGILYKVTQSSVVSTVVVDTAASPFSTIAPEVSIDDAGTVVFQATLDAGGEGIFNGPDPVANRIIGTGDTLGSSTVSTSANSLAIGTRAVDGTGQIVFWARLQTGGEGIYVATPGGVDTTPPVITTCAPDQEVSADTACAATVPGFTAAVVATDNCSASEDLVITQSPAAGTPAPLGESLVTITVRDAAGNTETCEATLTVKDTTPPTITGCPGNLFPSTTNGQCGWVAEWTEPTVTDKCPGATLVANYHPADVLPTGNIQVTYTATDIGNNTSKCEFTVSVMDNELPTISCPQDIVVEADAGQCSAQVTWDTPTATDNCAVTTFSSDHASGSVFSALTPTEVTYTVGDGEGNLDTCSFTVTVNERAPVITKCAADQTIVSGENCLVAVPDLTADVTATDDCTAAEALTITQFPAAGTLVGAGITDVLITVTDASGKSTTCTSKVTVKDETPPVITLNGPTSLTLQCHDSYTEQRATVADACDGNVAVSIGGDVVDANVPGTYSVTYDATDASGNAAATVTRTVTVEDTTAPVISVDTTPIVVMDTDCSGGEVVSLPAATATDACAGVVPVTNNAPAVFPLGVTIVTYTATDTAGNAATAQVSVTVNGAAIISVEAVKFSVNLGPRPGLTRAPLRGITVGAYKRTPNSCVSQNVWGNPFQIWPRIFNNCAPDYTAITDNNGEAQLQVSPGDYVVVTRFDNDNDGRWEYLGSIENSVHCGDVQRCRLRLLELANGQKCGAIITRLIGSELLILEPEVITWDEPEQLYPFVFESVGDWTVTTSVTPPDGFVPDYDALSARVTNEVEAVQFTITEVGSDLLPTETRFSIQHNGRRHLVRGRVGIQLTEKYARSRGFDPVKLRQKGLITDRPARQGR